jgi:hypothetical protein
MQIMSLWNKRPQALRLECWRETPGMRYALSAGCLYPRTAKASPCAHDVIGHAIFGFDAILFGNREFACEGSYVREKTP